MSKPKFNIGDRVQTNTRWGNVRGAVVEVTRIFKEVDATGAFIRGGLETDERDIKSIQVPHRFDGTVLEVDMPETRGSNFTLHAHTDRSLFYGWSYVVEGVVPGLSITRFQVPERKVRRA